MTARVRAHVFVTGKVQGVYYRQTAMEAARAHGVSGWIRNLQDGRVETVLEGDESNVSSVIEWCKRGPAKAQVEKVEVISEGYTGEFSQFTIIY
jgi:acylphosphatase